MVQVLLAEDNRLIAQSFSYQLTERGAVIHTVYSKSELVKAVNSARYDVVITNVKLEDGQVEVQELLNFQNLAEKLVVITGYPKDVLPSGINLLEKPISPRAFLDEVL